MAQKVPAIQLNDVLQIVVLAFKSQFSTCQIIDLEEDMILNFEKYVGLHENYDQLKSREWIYGKTPKFELHIMRPNTPNILPGEEDKPFEVVVERGVIQKSQHSNFQEKEPFYDAVISSGIFNI